MSRKQITVTFEFEADDEIGSQILTHVQRSVEDIWDPIDSELEVELLDLNVALESKEKIMKPSYFHYIADCLVNDQKPLSYDLWLQTTEEI